MNFPGLHLRLVMVENHLSDFFFSFRPFHFHTWGTGQSLLPISPRRRRSCRKRMHAASEVTTVDRIQNQHRTLYRVRYFIHNCWNYVFYCEKRPFVNAFDIVRWSSPQNNSYLWISNLAHLRPTRALKQVICSGMGKRLLIGKNFIQKGSPHHSTGIQNFVFCLHFKETICEHFWRKYDIP